MSRYSIKDSMFGKSYDFIDNETGKTLGIITMSADGFYNIGAFSKSKEAIKHIYDNLEKMATWQRYVLFKVYEYMDEHDVLRYPSSDKDERNSYDLENYPIRSYYNYLIKLARVFKYDADIYAFDQEEFEAVLAYYSDLGCMKDGRLVALPILRGETTKVDFRVQIDYRYMVDQFNSSRSDEVVKYEGLVRDPEPDVDFSNSPLDVVRTKIFFTREEVDEYFYEKLSPTYKKKLLTAAAKESDLVKLVVSRHPITDLSTIVALTLTYDGVCFPTEVIRSWPEKLLVAASLYWGTARFLTTAQILKVLDRPGLPTAFVEDILYFNTEPVVIEKIVAMKLLRPSTIRNSMAKSIKDTVYDLMKEAENEQVSVHIYSYLKNLLKGGKTDEARLQP